MLQNVAVLIWGSGLTAVQGVVRVCGLGVFRARIL